MTTRLPRDANGDKIQTLGVKDNGSHQISVSATSARNATRFDEKTFVVWLYATADLFFKIVDDDTAATATDHFLPAGVRTPMPVGRRGYIAAIQSTTSGTLYISEAQ